MPTQYTDFRGSRWENDPFDQIEQNQNQQRQATWAMQQQMAQRRQEMSDARAMNQDALNFQRWGAEFGANRADARDLRSQEAMARLAQLGYTHAENMYGKQRADLLADRQWSTSEGALNPYQKLQYDDLKAAQTRRENLRTAGQTYLGRMPGMEDVPKEFLDDPETAAAIFRNSLAPIVAQSGRTADRTIAAQDLQDTISQGGVLSLSQLATARAQGAKLSEEQVADALLNDLGFRAQAEAGIQAVNKKTSGIFGDYGDPNDSTVELANRVFAELEQQVRVKGRVDATTAASVAKVVMARLLGSSAAYGLEPQTQAALKRPEPFAGPGEPGGGPP